MKAMARSAPDFLVCTGCYNVIVLHRERNQGDRDDRNAAGGWWGWWGAWRRRLFPAGTVHLLYTYIHTCIPTYIHIYVCIYIYIYISVNVHIEYAYIAVCMP